MGFSSLKKEVEIESSGHLQFHLGKLHHMVGTNAGGSYVLTDDGKEAIRVLKLTSSGGIAPQVRTAPARRRNWTKPLLAGLLIALIVVSTNAVFQQQQIAMQQGQITSQEHQIALYVDEAHPFANGQSASLVLGQRDFTSYRPATSQSGIYDPVQALFDPSGNLWVLDSGNSRVLEFKPPFSNGMDASLVIGQKTFGMANWSVAKDGFGGPGFYRNVERITNGPGGAAFDSSGNLWVTDLGNNRVLEFKPPFATGMSASLVIGQRNFSTGFSGSSRSGLSAPTEPAFDSLGNLWVYDSGNNRVLEFKPPFSNGMNASLVIGQPSFDDNSPSLSQSGIHSGPYGSDLAIDPFDNLWVGDNINNRLLEFEPPFSNGMNASVVIGQPSFTTNNGASVNHPEEQFGLLGYAIAFDPTGNLWATYHQRLFEFKPPFTTNMPASLEIGQPDLTSPAVWVGGQNGLSYPGHPGFDSSGNMWVPDSSNNRVLEFVSGFPAGSTSTTDQGVQPFGQLQLIGIGAAILIGAVLSVVLIRRKGLSLSPSIR